MWHRCKLLLQNPDFREGARDMSGVAAGVGAWGLVTGIAMVKSGLSVPLALLMSAVVFAGSAQLAAIPLMGAGAPVWMVLATALCVNLRFVIFSAQWRPYWIHLPLRQRLWAGYFCPDLTYVLFMKRFEHAHSDKAAQLPYFWGVSFINWAAWQVPSIAGIFLANVVPPQWGLGFAGVLALAGLTFSLLHDRATWAAAIVASAAAVAAYALPLKLNLIVAIAAAVALGLLMDGGGDGLKRLQRWWFKAVQAKPKEVA